MLTFNTAYDLSVYIFSLSLSDFKDLVTDNKAVKVGNQVYMNVLDALEETY